MQRKVTRNRISDDSNRTACDGRPSLRKASLLGLCLALMIARAAAEGDGAARKPALSKEDHATLAQLRVAGKKSATLLIVTTMGQTASVAESLRRGGCSIKETADEIGYIRCVIPLDRLEPITNVPGIEKIEVSTMQLGAIYGPPVGPVQDTEINKPRNVPGPTRFMTRDNPFTALDAMQVLSFREKNPSYDGRGTAVSVLEHQIDPRTPELKWAKDIHGKTIPKLLDWNFIGEWSFPDPAMPDWSFPSFLSGRRKLAPPFWVIITEPVEELPEETVVFHGEKYFLPQMSGKAEWRMGVFDAHSVRPPFGPLDTNLDGVVDDSDNYTFLFDVRGRRVWIDLNHNHDFRDEKPFRDFSDGQEFGVFGKDNSAAEWRTSRPFVIHLDPEKTDIWLEIGMTSHGDMVASVLAGKSFLGSEADGIAPDAQIVLDHASVGFIHTFITQLLRAFQDRRTDVITDSGGDDDRPSDGSHVLDVLASRMIDVYRKPLFVSAGNDGPSIGLLTSPGDAPKAFSIGGYTPLEAWKANYGITPSTAEALLPYSSVGPGDNGGLKPDLLGITGTLATTAGFDKHDVIFSPYFTPPAGYTVSGGTSAAAPTAAGAAALLISAAKQAGIPYDAARLRIALLSSAKFLPGVPAQAQGNGVIQVADAWQALQKLKAASWKPVEIVSNAPVKTVASRRFRVPDRGVGIFEREGWNLGMVGTRQIVFTRKNGPAKPVTYKLAWKGGTDVFSSVGEITLPLNQAVQLAVQIHPRDIGSFSAILSLIDNDTGLMVYQTLNTVVVPYVLDAADGYHVNVSGKAPRPGNANFFVRVPAGTQIFQVRAKVKSCDATLEIADPEGVQPKRINGAFPRSENPAAEPDKDREIQKSFDDPKPGVWQVSIQNESDVSTYDAKAPNPLQPCAFDLTARALHVDVDPATASVKPQQEYPAQMTNKMAGFNGTIATPGLGSARFDHPTLRSEFEPVTYEIDVPKGATRVEAAISRDADPDTDIDLYLFDGSVQPPYLAAFSSRDSSEQRVQVLDPKPGKWIVVVDASRLPHGPTQINYRDLFYHDAFGKIEIKPHADSNRSSDAKSASFSANVQARPAGNRLLVGTVNVVSDDIYVSIANPDAAPGSTKRVPIPLQTIVFAVE